MLKVYPAVFIAEETGYSVIFPDLEGCQTQGETMEEAVIMAQEALGLYLTSLEEDKMEIPKASSPPAIAIADNEFVTMITTDIEKYRRKNKAVKKTLSIPQWLNDEAELRHINFSSVLQKALKEELSIAE